MIWFILGLVCFLVVLGLFFMPENPIAFAGISLVAIGALGFVGFIGLTVYAIFFA